MPIDNFYDTQMDNAGATSDNVLREQIRKSGTNVFYPAAGDALNWDPGEVQVKVFNSCSVPGQTSVGQVMNDCSIVLKVTYQNASILYTGDLQDDVEPALVKQYGPELKADLLKVGHHGSQHSTSDALLAAVQPRDAVISVGADNSYGHPTPGCLARLRTAGAVIHRTDTDGTMIYTIGANSASMKSPATKAGEPLYRSK
jgi:competence protein ComEC